MKPFSDRSKVGKHVGDAAGEAGDDVLAAELVGRRQMGRTAAGTETWIVRVEG